MLSKLTLCFTAVCAGGMLVSDVQAQFTTTTVATGMAQPLFVTAPPGDTTRLFIVEQKRSQGTSNRADIRILDLTTNPPTLLPTPFLTINGISTSDEQGLLGLAFHPDYASNRAFFIYYTNPSGNLVRYKTMVGNRNVADTSTATTILTFSEPEANHNGGWLSFGPDGYLYLSTGDGGGGNDQHVTGNCPNGNGQCLNILLGKILRISVTDTGTYTVPPTNPFPGATAPFNTIWAYGLRNPWRCSFDRMTGDMYIGDVGQSSPTGREEVNFQPAGVGGRNYGWVCKNGPNCSGLNGCSCPQASFIDPIHNYATGSSCTVIGGYVYRGSAIPAIQGRYFFADYCTAVISSFIYNGTNSQSVTTHFDAGSSLTSFGEDAAGELYYTLRGSTSASTGSVVKIVPVPPINDTCAGATLVGMGSTAFSTAVAATDGPDEGGCGFGPPTQITNDVWYKFTATCTGTATVSVCGANFDTRIAAYGSNCPAGAGETLGCNDNFCGSASQVSFPVVFATQYRIRIGSADGTTGSGTMVISCAKPPVCPADINGDGSVNVTDLLAVINSWGPCADCPADTNGDDQVNVTDLLAVINGWGPCV